MRHHVTTAKTFVKARSLSNAPEKLFINGSQTSASDAEIFIADVQLPIALTRASIADLQLPIAAMKVSIAEAEEPVADVKEPVADLALFIFLSKIAKILGSQPATLMALLLAIAEVSKNSCMARRLPC